MAPRARKGITSKMGRPLVHIDWEKVKEYCQLGCPATEVAACIGVSYTTLVERCQLELKKTFSELRQECLEKGNKEIRRLQVELAHEKDRTMLVWLGKNRLGQRDQPEPPPPPPAPVPSADATMFSVYFKELQKQGMSEIEAIRAINKKLDELLGQ